MTWGTVKMKAYCGEEAEDLRFLFIHSFVDTSSDYYHDYIQKTEMYADGLHYSGYLWDCMKNKRGVSFASVLNILMNYKNTIYILWDNHSYNKIKISNYWKYPRDSVLVAEPQEIGGLVPILPEDCYFFDDTLSIAYVLTHEETKSGKRFCFVSNV